MLTTQRFNRLVQSVAEDPWRTLAAMSDSLLRDWEASFAGPSHQGDIWATKGGLVFELPLPGRNSEDIDVSVEGRRLEVTAKAPARPEGDARVLRSERVHGEFKYAWNLPFEPNVEGIKVDYRNGVLRIEIQQSPAAARRTLTVNAS